MVEHRTMSQQEMLDQQKMQCPFCKIIKGDIPSKKVYEDEKLIAVLDINPLREGHVLLMPKDHYPIMPLVPERTFESLFIITKRFSEIEKSVFEKSGTTIFIANGAAAGQQSAHFMLHIIPRDDGDGLINFEVPHNKLDKDKHKELFELLSNNLKLMLKDRYGKFPLKDKDGNIIKLDVSEKVFSKSQVLQIIENNPQLKEVIMKDPQEFVASVDKTPQLKQLFANLDVHEVVKEVNPSYKKGKVEKREEIVEAEFKEARKEPSSFVFQQPEVSVKPKTVKEEAPKEEKKPEKKSKPKKKKKTKSKPEQQVPDDANLDLISRLF